MGCDIHAYIEYWNPSQNEPYVSSLGGQFGVRDYTMFGHLAGVRYTPHCGPVSAPKGLPEGELSWQVEQAAYLTVNDEGAAKGWVDFCSDEQARSWGNEIIEGRHRRRTVHPDWHSFSWLSTEEVAQAIGQYFAYDGEYP